MVSASSAQLRTSLSLTQTPHRTWAGYQYSAFWQRFDYSLSQDCFWCNWKAHILSSQKITEWFPYGFSSQSHEGPYGHVIKPSMWISLPFQNLRYRMNLSYGNNKRGFLLSIYDQDWSISWQVYKSNGCSQQWITHECTWCINQNEVTSGTVYHQQLCWNWKSSEYGQALLGVASNFLRLVSTWPIRWELNTSGVGTGCNRLDKSHKFILRWRDEPSVRFLWHASCMSAVEEGCPMGVRIY